MVEDGSDGIEDVVIGGNGAVGPSGFVLGVATEFDLNCQGEVHLAR